jgi:hypothetical protein
MTLGEMRDYVRDRLSIAASDTTKQTQIDLVLNTEYRRICAEERLNIEKTTMGLVAGSQLADLPNDWQETITVRHGATVLQPVTFMRFAELDAASENGTNTSDGPSAYYQESPERIRVWPTPVETNSTALTLWYVARPDAMTLVTHTPSVLPVEYHDLLAEMAVVRIAQNEEQFDIAQAAQATVNDLRLRMSGQMRRRQGSGQERVVLNHYGVGT